MTNRPQNSDRLTLEETLDAMRRLGVAPAEYIEGYECGYRGRVSALWTVPFQRGYKAGRAAHERGAHR